MKIIEADNQLSLEKNGEMIGHCHYELRNATPLTVEITAFEISAQWRRKGYGTYLCKALLRCTGGYDAKRESCYHITLPNESGQENAACTSPQNDSVSPSAGNKRPCEYDCNGTTAFFTTFNFTPSANGKVLTRHKKPDLTAITFAQQFLRTQLAGQAPTFCIDATCGNGHDSLFLAQWMGKNGHLLAMDVQEKATASTAKRLAAAGIDQNQYTLVCDTHANLAQYATPECANAILFNFGWLPGADHSVFSAGESSLPALNAALATLKHGGMLSAILYSGQGIGHSEKEAVLAWLRTLPITEYTVLCCDFANWNETAPLPCFVLKK